MMKDAILNFAKQFEYNPEVVNFDKLKKSSKFLVCGMGGSHLAADLLKVWDPALDLVVHSDYGVPDLPDLDEHLIILSSYSGNTEEVLDAYEQVRDKNVVVITVGGKLLEIAKAEGLPCVEMPDTGIQPRSALGFSMVGLMKLMGLEDGLEEIQKMSKKIKPATFEKKGKKLAEDLKDMVPVIYSSAINSAIAYNWKIKLNETGKVPAFYNVVPELNHNEMTGFDVADSTKHLSDKFLFIFLTDKDDHPKIQKRMKITQKLYSDRGLKTVDFKLKSNIFEKIFESLVIADWAAVYLAQSYGLESEQVPMVEEFKKLVN